MKINSDELLQDLIERTRIIINQTETIKKLFLEKLNWHKEQDSWSILECFEHLNLYGDFYLLEIEKRINESSHKKSKTFKSGLLGNYFAKSMLPRERLNKMKTFKDKNPIGSQLTKNTISRFVEQQRKLLHLLDNAPNINLNKTKTSISISRFIKLKLGDTFRVVVYQNERHLVQVKNVVKENEL